LADVEDNLVHSPGLADVEDDMSSDDIGRSSIPAPSPLTKTSHYCPKAVSASKFKENELSQGMTVAVTTMMVTRATWDYKFGSTADPSTSSSQ
jgi:hypothetical protein